MALNETILTGRKFRRNIGDTVNAVWQRLSWWTHAKDVEFDDGKTAQTKLGNINGISSSNTSASTDIAASIGRVNSIATEINSQLGGMKVIINDEGRITGYTTTKGGADTVFPFSGAIRLGTIKSAGTKIFKLSDYGLGNETDVNKFLWVSTLKNGSQGTSSISTGALQTAISRYTAPAITLSNGNLRVTPPSHQALGSDPGTAGYANGSINTISGDIFYIGGFTDYVS